MSSASVLEPEKLSAEAGSKRSGVSQSQRPDTTLPRFLRSRHIPVVVVHEKGRHGDSFESARDRFIEDAIKAEQQYRERQPRSGEDRALREDEPEELFLSPSQRRTQDRIRAAQLAFRERKGKHLKQLEAYSENLETQASATHAGTQVRRKQIKDINILLKDSGKDGMEISQEAQLPDSVSVDDHTQTKGYQQSEAFVDDPARSSMPKLRPESSPVSTAIPPRCSHGFQASCSRCLESRGPPKSRSSPAPAPKTDSSLQASAEFLPSGTSALPGVDQPECYIHANALTPPETPTVENENAALDSLAVGNIVTPKPLNSKEVADEELQDQHKGRNPDVVRKDEQVLHPASNDGGSLQGEDHQLQKFHVPAIPSRSSADAKPAAKSGVPPDARWTTISKNLVDARVLDDSNERYKENTGRGRGL